MAPVSGPPMQSTHFKFLPRGNIDLYYMGLDNQSVPFDGKGTGREQRDTIGTRLWGTTEHWDYNYEPTFQWGSFRSYDIRAWAVSTETGYRIRLRSSKPKVWPSSRCLQRRSESIRAYPGHV